MARSRYLWALSVSVFAFALASPAMAQGANSADDPYAPLGTNIGGFTLYPSVTLSVGHDDNVYASAANAISDSFYLLRPEATLISNWSRHSVEVSAGTEFQWYSEQSSEDHSEAWVSLSGRADVSYQTSLHARASYRAASEDRGGANRIGLANELTDFSLLEGSVELRHRTNSVGVSIGGGFESYDFDDVAAIGGGTIDNDFRDFTTLLGYSTINYAVAPDMRLFVRGTVNSREYDQTPPAALSRDSQGYEVVGGLLFDVTRLISGEIFAGYLEQDYDVRTDVDGVSYGADLQWEVTRLTNILLGASRTVEETNQAATASLLRSEASIGLEHELLRNLILNADFTIANEDFSGIAREDDLWSASAGFEYRLNRNVAASAGYTYQSRDSNVPATGYDRGNVRGGITLRY